MQFRIWTFLFLVLIIVLFCLSNTIEAKGARGGKVGGGRPGGGRPGGGKPGGGRPGGGRPGGGRPAEGRPGGGRPAGGRPAGGRPGGGRPGVFIPGSVKVINVGLGDAHQLLSAAKQGLGELARKTVRQIWPGGHK